MFVRQFKKLDDNGNATDAGSDESMFVLTNLVKVKEKRLKFSERRVTVLQKITNYLESRVILRSTKLNKLKSAAENKIETTLRITKKNFQDEELQR